MNIRQQAAILPRTGGLKENYFIEALIPPKNGPSWNQETEQNANKIAPGHTLTQRPRGCASLTLLRLCSKRANRC